MDRIPSRRDERDRQFALIKSCAEVIPRLLGWVCFGYIVVDIPLHLYAIKTKETAALRVAIQH